MSIFDDLPEVDNLTERKELLEKIEKLEDENKELREALSCLVAIVGLTAFKYKNQREVLQESIDDANKVLKGGKKL